MLHDNFFDRDVRVVAPDLLGCIIRVKHQNDWLSAQIIETEAYCLADKASHASLGYTDKRRALFMPAGTIYMYYARGGDSLNVSCRGDGDAVLIKSGVIEQHASPRVIEKMQALNPINGRIRPTQRLCSGQTLLCRSLGLRVKDWDQKNFDKNHFYIERGPQPQTIVQTTRLGIPNGRDGHLPYRYMDYEKIRHATQNPIGKCDYTLHDGLNSLIIPEKST